VLASALLGRAILMMIASVATTSPASTSQRSQGPAPSHSRRLVTHAVHRAGATTPPGTRRLAPPYDFRSVEARIAKELAARSIPSVTVSVAKGGKIVYERAFGYADIAHGIRATTATVYRLASISKPLTATGIMVLQQEGRVDLDAPAERYMGSLTFVGTGGQGSAVTVRHLLSHTSGLAPYFQYAFEGHQREADSFRDAFSKYGVIVQPPGTLMEYSNTGFGLLGEIAARQSGTPFPTFMANEVFAPLGMTHSFFDRAPSAKLEVAVGYDAALHPLPALFDNTSGAGGAYSTPHDLMLFAMFSLRPRSAPRAILTEAAVRSMTSSIEPGPLSPLYHATQYGLGWYFRDDEGGFKTMWHEGGMPGASTYVKMVPAEDVAAVALANVGDRNALVDSLVDDLIKVVLPAYHPEALNPTADYTLYAGSDDYQGTWSGTATVAGRDLPFALTFDSAGSIHASYGRHDAPPAAADVSFRGVINGASFIGSFTGGWPSDDIPPGVTPILVMHLVRRGSVLSGRINAYSASALTLQFFYPYYVRLERGKTSG
jgi:CubicO group peptidase (beta-lactamase class C family)